MGAYHPPSQSNSYFFEHLDKALDIYSNYEKVLQEISTQKLQSLVWIPSYIYMMWSHLQKKKTCFKSIRNLTCINLFLPNSNLSFQHTETASTGLSDFHMLVVRVLKTCFLKTKPIELEYLNYKNVNSVLFNEDVKYIFYIQLNLFDEIFLEALDKQATRKTKILSANYLSYVSKAMRKRIMKRSYLEKLYFRNSAENSLKAYKRLKNYCSRLYKKEKENKTFWKTIKPFFFFRIKEILDLKENSLKMAS